MKRLPIIIICLLTTGAVMADESPSVNFDSRQDDGIYISASPPIRPFVFSIGGKNWKRCKDFMGIVDCEYWDSEENKFLSAEEQLAKDEKRLFELKGKDENYKRLQ